MTDTTSPRDGATEANWAWAQAYAEISKTPLNQIKGDLYKALHTRATEIRLGSRPQPTQSPGEMAVVEEFASGTANHRPAGPKLRMTDEQMRNEWCSAGGDMHGPITETVVMPLADYLNFRRDLDAISTGRPANALENLRVLEMHLRAQTGVVPMILRCPRCQLQHIDAPEPHEVIGAEGRTHESGWTNPPHRSHLCAGCGYIWRPADVPTTGVAAITTRGQNDSQPGLTPSITEGVKP